jgi:hypothetical protein
MRRKFWYDLSVARKPREAPVLRITGFFRRSSMMTSYFSFVACQPVRLLPSKMGTQLGQPGKVALPGGAPPDPPPPAAPPVPPVAPPVPPPSARGPASGVVAPPVPP